MKTQRLICAVAVSLTLSAFSASAQIPKPERPEGGPRPEHHQMALTPRQRAEQRTNEIDSNEYIDAREEKFRKILSAEQYATWRKLHPDPSGFFID